MVFFQRGFSILASDFLRGLLHHYKIELTHLNPNSILQITVFVHLYKAYLSVLPNYALFKHYFFLKYQPSGTKHQVMGGIGIQARPHRFFLKLPLKTSLKGCQQQWLYCKNQELSLPQFVGRLPKYDKTRIEEPVEAEIPMVKALASRVSELKGLGLIGVGVVANWLAYRVVLMKKQVHPGWEYYGVQYSTQELGNNIEASKLVDLLKELFENTNNWPTPKQVRSYHL
jgi:hypothetical protein